MGEVTPPEAPRPSGRADVGGIVTGVIVGLVVSVFASAFVVLGAFGSGLSAPSGSNCGPGIAYGLIALVVAAALGWFAWHMVFRNPARSFGSGFLRGSAVVVALFFLIPWPCSLTWSAVGSFSACAH